MVGVVITLSVIVAVYTDIRWMIIPNWLTYGLILTGMVLHLLLGHPLNAILSGVVGGFILFIPALFGQVGMGDVKWLAGIGVWTSIPFVVISFALASVVGLLYVLGTLWWKVMMKRRTYREVRKEPIPYGVSLGVGILASLWIANAGWVIHV